jgi:hypothetical protein
MGLRTCTKSERWERSRLRTKLDPRAESLKQGRKRALWLLEPLVAYAPDAQGSRLRLLEFQ